MKVIWNRRGSSRERCGLGLERTGSDARPRRAEYRSGPLFSRRPFSGSGVTFGAGCGRTAAPATPTFSETLSSFNECVRSL